MSVGRNHVDELRGLGRLAAEATRGVTDVVQAMHGEIGGAPARLFSWPAYAMVRAITSLTGGALDVALDRLARVAGEGAAGPARDAVIAALNGVLGDYLEETRNPLAMEMILRSAGPATPRLLVLVHGSSMNAQAWGTPPDLGRTPVLLEYNSGLHVSANGRAFSALLEDLVDRWPVPVESIAMVGHSMGGLVARSACHAAQEAGHRWPGKLRALIFLGTPHHGAPLERGGNVFETLLGVTRYSAPLAALGRIRSAGVTDLRFGNVVDAHWAGRDRFEPGLDARVPVPLPAGVECWAVAAEDDGLVPLASALGDHPDPSLALGIPPSHRFVAKGVGHVALPRDPQVWSRVERWLA